MDRLLYITFSVAPNNLFVLTLDKHETSLLSRLLLDILLSFNKHKSQMFFIHDDLYTYCDYDYIFLV